MLFQFLLVKIKSIILNLLSLTMNYMYGRIIAITDVEIFCILDEMILYHLLVLKIILYSDKNR